MLLLKDCIFQKKHRNKALNKILPSREELKKQKSFVILRQN